MARTNTGSVQEGRSTIWHRNPPSQQAVCVYVCVCEIRRSPSRIIRVELRLYSTQLNTAVAVWRAWQRGQHYSHTLCFWQGYSVYVCVCVCCSSGVCSFFPLIWSDMTYFWHESGQSHMIPGHLLIVLFRNRFCSGWKDLDFTWLLPPLCLSAKHSHLGWLKAGWKLAPERTRGAVNAPKQEWRVRMQAGALTQMTGIWCMSKSARHLPVEHRCLREWIIGFFTGSADRLPWRSEL